MQPERHGPHVVGVDVLKREDSLAKRVDARDAEADEVGGLRAGLRNG